jgi:hypothetical protein
MLAKNGLFCMVFTPKGSEKAAISCLKRLFFHIFLAQSSEP